MNMKTLGASVGDHNWDAGTKMNRLGKAPLEMCMVVGHHTEHYCRENPAACRNIFAGHQSMLVAQQPSQNYPKNRLQYKTACAGQMIVVEVAGYRFWEWFAMTLFSIVEQNQRIPQQSGVAGVLI